MQNSLSLSAVVRVHASVHRHTPAYTRAHQHAKFLTSEICSLFHSSLPSFPPSIFSSLHSPFASLSFPLTSRGEDKKKRRQSTQRAQGDSWLGDVTPYLWEEGIRFVHSSVSRLKQSIVGPGNLFIQGHGHKFQGEALTCWQLRVATLWSCHQRHGSFKLEAAVFLLHRPPLTLGVNHLCDGWKTIMNDSPRGPLWVSAVLSNCPSVTLASPCLWGLFKGLALNDVKEREMTLCASRWAFSKSNGQNFHLKRWSAQDWVLPV